MPEPILKTERDAKLDEMLAIADGIATFVAGNPHSTTIDALMLVFKALARHHECCTEGASMMCATVAMELSQLAESRRGQGSGVVH